MTSQEIEHMKSTVGNFDRFDKTWQKAFKEYNEDHKQFYGEDVFLSCRSCFKKVYLYSKQQFELKLQIS